MFDKIFSSTEYLEKGLDASWTRNEVITNNIANVDTVGFKRSEVEFESVFQAALEGSSFSAKRTREGHLYTGSSDLDSVSATIIEDNSTSMRLDGNNVDIDYESAELAKNNIYYNTLIQKLTSEFTRLRMAIKEGE
jgi:flagellar basal-body rod protein FlgB